jgi:hypothetical protein
VTFLDWIRFLSICTTMNMVSDSRIRIHLIRIQHFRLNRYRSGSKGLMTKNGKKIKAEIFFFFFQNHKIYLSLGVGLHKERPSYRKSLQLSKKNIQHCKTLNFLIFLLLCSVSDPDPHVFGPTGSGSISQRHGSADPDPH